MANIILLNNFLHDFSAAGWIFCTVLLWQIMKLNIKHDVLTHEILLLIRKLMLISAAGIVIFGLVRALAYKTYEWNAAAGDAQITLLIVKHIILAAVFGAGVFYYRKAGAFLKESGNE